MKVAFNQMMGWVRRNAARELVFLAISAGLAYGGYVYILQTPAFYIKSWLAPAGLWLGLFGLLHLAARPLAVVWRVARRALPGVLGLWMLANLVLVVNPPAIPYTTFLLPVRAVSITPVSNPGGLTIEAFSSESEGALYLKSFRQAEGWAANDSGGFSLAAGDVRGLAWSGRPGEYVELRFATCAGAECGRVRVEAAGGAAQEVDLSGAADARGKVVRVNFDLLFLLRALNLGALEGALLLLTAAVFAGLERLTSGRQPGAARGGAIGTGWAGLIVAVFGLAVFGLKLQPILFNDDWCQVAYTFHFDTRSPFMDYERRPLHLILPEFFNGVLPPDLAVWGLQISQLLILLGSALLSYRLIKELFKGRDGLALLAALLWLVFPNDYSRFYLATIAARLAYLLTLVVMLLTVRFLKRGEWPTGWLCGGLLFASFWMYEGQLGLALVWPAALLALGVGRFTRRGLVGLAGYGLGIGAFLYWKLAVQPSSAYADSKLDYLNLAPGELAGRYFDGLRAILGGFQLPLAISDWLTPANGLVLAGLVGGAVLVYRLARGQAPAAGERWADVRLAGLGLALWAAGYLPIIFNFPVNIYGHLSRVNIFSILGAVVLLTALVDLVAVEWLGTGAACLTLPVMLGLIVCGAAVQMQVQDSYNASWQETRVFYRELFAAAPDVKPGTRLVLTIAGYEDLAVAQRPIFTSNWEATCALATLYDQPGLTVDYQYTDIPVPVFPSNNVLAGTLIRSTYPVVEQPGGVLGLEYDHRTRQVRVRPDLEGLLAPGAEGRYAPFERIVPLERCIETRGLVK